MQKQRFPLMSVMTGILLVFTAALWLATAQGVKAQCGTQASTCTDCHEVQGQMPVNADGTGWHQSHAFGDFCYICHAGNNTALEKEAAHAGMVPPLSDVKAACKQCHPKDLAERTAVYAGILGIEAGGLEASQPSAPAAAETSGGSAAPAMTAVCATPGDSSVVLVKPATSIDYVARYNREVLGDRQETWNQLGLYALIAAIVILAASLLVAWKGWLRITFQDMKSGVFGSADHAEKSEE